MRVIARYECENEGTGPVDIPSQNYPSAKGLPLRMIKTLLQLTTEQILINGSIHKGHYDR